MLEQPAEALFALHVVDADHRWRLVVFLNAYQPIADPLMWATWVIVAQILPHQTVEMLLGKDQEVVGALDLNYLNQPLDIGLRAPLLIAGTGGPAARLAGHCFGHSGTSRQLGTSWASLSLRFALACSAASVEMTPASARCIVFSIGYNLCVGVLAGARRRWWQRGWCARHGITLHQPGNLIAAAVVSLAAVAIPLMLDRRRPAAADEGAG